MLTGNGKKMFYFIQSSPGSHMRGKPSCSKELPAAEDIGSEQRRTEQLENRLDSTLR